MKGKHEKDEQTSKRRNQKMGNIGPNKGKAKTDYTEN